MPNTKKTNRKMTAKQKREFNQFAARYIHTAVSELPLTEEQKVRLANSETVMRVVKHRFKKYYTPQKDAVLLMEAVVCSVLEEAKDVL